MEEALERPPTNTSGVCLRVLNGISGRKAFCHALGGLSQRMRIDRKMLSIQPPICPLHIAVHDPHAQGQKSDAARIRD